MRFHSALLVIPATALAIAGPGCTTIRPAPAEPSWTDALLAAESDAQTPDCVPERRLAAGELERMAAAQEVLIRRAATVRAAASGFERLDDPETYARESLRRAEPPGTE